MTLASAQVPQLVLHDEPSVEVGLKTKGPLVGRLSHAHWPANATNLLGCQKHGLPKREAKSRNSRSEL